MSAQKLREAARLMRERAHAASPAPWFRGLGADGGLQVHSEARLAGGDDYTDVATPAWANGDAAHIASWDPAVALAVADWLDHDAEAWEQYAKQGRGLPFARQERSVAVATAYLGADR